MFSSPVSAQVNINSKTDEEDSGFFELSDSDTTIIIEQSTVGPGDTTIEPTDIIDIETLPETGTQVNSPITIIRNLQQGVKNIEDTIVESGATPDFLKTVVTTLGFPTASALGFSLAFLPAIISLIPLILSPQLLFLMLSAIFGERKNVWGIVYDAETKKPIAFSVVRLFEQDSTAQITQKVSDLEGRYGFVLSEGKYRLEVRQSSYEVYTKNVNVTKETDLFAEDIALSKQKYGSFGAALRNGFETLRSLIFKYSIYLSLVGFLFSLLAMIVQPNMLNALLFLFYLVIILLYLYIKFRGRRQWGVIFNSESGLKIAGATIRLFDPKNSLSDTQMSDSRGRFGFLTDPGEYTLLVNAAGHKFPSKKQKDLKLNKVNKNLLDIVVTKTGLLNLELLLDPVAGVGLGSVSVPTSTTGDRNNLLSPFAG